ncbi:gamma-glutamyltransferase, partial [Corynebacterium nasicanis]
MKPLFRTRARGVTAALGAAALVLTACAEDAPETTSETPTTTTTTTTTSAAHAASEVTTITSSNCEFDAAPAGEATGETSGGSDRDITTNPEIATGYRAGMQAVETQNFAVATANPVATQAACDVLLAGGSAADAVVTAQFVLGLTEPQSSGLGGGGYILYYDAATGETIAIDGREVAPLAADENYLRHISAEDQSAPVPDARRSGRSIGVPGMVAALGTVHERYGTRAWAENLTPARDLAAEGFEISPRMAASVASAAEDLARDPQARAHFLDEDGDAKEAGTMLQNPDYAGVVDKLASEGPDAFYTGEIAQGIVESAAADAEGMTPSLMTTADLAGYTPVVHEALCAPYRDTLVCGMPPSSSGGVAVLETLRLLDAHDLARYAPRDAGPDGALP